MGETEAVPQPSSRLLRWHLKVEGLVGIDRGKATARAVMTVSRPFGRCLVQSPDDVAPRWVTSSVGYKVARLLEGRLS